MAADFYIKEYARLAQDLNGNVIAAGLEPAITTQKVSNPIASTQSAALNANTAFVKIHVDGGDGHFLVGADPTAAVTDDQLSAGETQFFGVTPGVGLKIACINGA